MSGMRICLVMGTRPEAIKLAPIALAMRERAGDGSCVILSTGQQREMLPQALAEFDLRPDVSLDVMRPDQTLAGLTGRLFERLEPALAAIAPDWLVVQGDTTSAMVGAMVGFYARTRVAHVEAGLRSHDRFAPYPEEVNRKVIGSVADLHFAPTDVARENLIREGVPDRDVRVVGNTGIDALFWMRDRVRGEGSRLEPALYDALRGRKVILVTGHRRENFDEGLEQVCLALRRIVDRHEDAVVVYPVHPNPNVDGPVRSRLSGDARIVLIDPLPYGQFVELMDRAHLILSDSGGVQEEAPSLGRPVLVMRGTTERPEGLGTGNAVLVGTRADAIEETVSSLLLDADRHARMSTPTTVYGDGRSAERILELLVQRCNGHASHPGETELVSSST